MDLLSVGYDGVVLKERAGARLKNCEDSSCY
jgi:hypothetical protein